MWALCVDWPAARSASVRCSPPGRNLVQARTNRRAEMRQGLGATTSFKQHLRAHRSAAARACSGVRKGEYTSKLHSPDHCTRGATQMRPRTFSGIMDLKVAQLVVFLGLFLPCTRQASSTRAPPLAHAPVAQSADAAQKLQAAVQSADFSKAAAGIPGAKIGAPTVTGVCERAR